MPRRPPPPPAATAPDADAAHAARERLSDADAARALRDRQTDADAARAARDRQSEADAARALRDRQSEADAARAARDRQWAAWLAAAAAGDVRAFEAFHDASHGYARALARRIVAAADLDDVLAEAYLQSWQQCARFDPARGSAVAWLLTIVRSRALDQWRRSDGAPLPPPDAGDAPADPLPGPDALLEQAERGSRLHAALAALSARERWLLGLAFFRELSHAQIAQCTGLPLGTVKSVILRAQARLRERLAPLAGG